MRIGPRGFVGYGECPAPSLPLNIVDLGLYQVPDGPVTPSELGERSIF